MTDECNHSVDILGTDQPSVQTRRCHPHMPKWAKDSGTIGWQKWKKPVYVNPWWQTDNDWNQYDPFTAKAQKFTYNRFLEFIDVTLNYPTFHTRMSLFFWAQNGESRQPDVAEWNKQYMNKFSSNYYTWLHDVRTFKELSGADSANLTEYPDNIVNDVTRWDVLRHARDLERENYVERRNWEL